MQHSSLFYWEKPNFSLEEYLKEKRNQSTNCSSGSKYDNSTNQSMLRDKDNQKVRIKW